MHSTWSILALVAGLCASAPSPIGDPPETLRADAIPTDELLRALDLAQDRLEGWHVALELEAWSERCADLHHVGRFLPPLGVSEQRRSVLKNRITVVRDQDRYRIEQDTLASGGGGDGAAFNLGDTRSTLAFDGMNYITSMKSSAGQENYLIGLDDEFHGMSTGSLDLCGWWVLGQTREGYADHFRKADGKPQSSLLPDGQTEWSFFLHNSQRQTVIRLRAQRGRAGHIQLTYASMSVYRTPEDLTDDNLRLRFSVDFSDCREEKALGVVIPHAAECLWAFAGDEPTGHYWTLNKVRVVSIERPADRPSLFHPVPSPTAQVGDSRYRLGYKLGDDMLNVDGRPLRTHETLHGEVGERLEWWIKHGEFSPVWDEDAQEFISEDHAP